MHKIFVVGCGDIGLRVARQCLERRWPVTALVRSEASAQRLRGAGLDLFHADLDRADSLVGLPTAGAGVFYFVPPPEAGGATDPRVAAFAAAMTQALPHRVVYLSTSGVYGDRDGGWVDEDTPPDPRTVRGKRRLSAEQTLRAWGERLGVPVIVLRVGGIYGPGRLPVQRLRQGLAVLEPAACGFTNRIHADDLATVCLAALERGRPGAVYNVSDGQPGTMTEYFLAVADRLGLPQPPTVSWEEAQRTLTPAMLSYLGESRRMDTRRLREELAVTLRYPTLADGLAAVDPAAELGG